MQYSVYQYLCSRRLSFFSISILIGIWSHCVEQVSSWAQNKTRELILQKYSNFFAPLARTEGSSAWFDDDRKPQKSNPIKMWSRRIFHTECHKKLVHICFSKKSCIETTLKVSCLLEPCRESLSSEGLNFEIFFLQNITVSGFGKFRP